MLKLFNLFVIVTAFTAPCLAIFVRRSIDQIESDIATLISETDSLKTGLNAFAANGQPGTVVQALALQASGQNLLLSIATTTTDVQSLGGRVSDGDGRRILDNLELFVPTIVETTDIIGAKKPAFDAVTLLGIVPMPASAIVLGLLRSVGTAVGTLTQLGLQVAPLGLVEEATQQKAIVDDAFTQTIAVYS